MSLTLKHFAVIDLLSHPSQLAAGESSVDLSDTERWCECGISLPIVAVPLSSGSCKRTGALGKQNSLSSWACPSTVAWDSVLGLQQLQDFADFPDFDLPRGAWLFIQ